MRRFGCSILFAAAVLLGCGSITLADTVSLTYLHNSGIYQGGYAVGPRAVEIDGVPASLVCNDFDHNIPRNVSYEYYVSTFDSLTHVRFVQGTPGDTLRLYDEAAYLYLQMLASPSSGWGDIQYALWALFDSAVESQPGWTAGASNWLALAQGQSFTPGEFSNVLVYTPVSGGQQEFLGNSSTPEPGTLLLLGTGLLGGLLRRRKRQ